MKLFKVVVIFTHIFEFDNLPLLDAFNMFCYIEEKETMNANTLKNLIWSPEFEMHVYF